MPRRRMPRLPPRRPRQPRLPDQAMPDAIADSYEQELVALAAEVRARFEREVMPRVLAELERRTDAGDAGLPNIRQLMRWADSATFTRRAGRLVKLKAEQLDMFNESAVNEQLRTVVQFDVFDFIDVDTRRAVDAWTRENIDLIKTIPKQYLSQCEEIIVDAYQRGRRAEFVAKDLMGRGDVSFSRARFIATDQSFKLNAALTQARHEQLGSDHYIWRTSRDGRVRDEHAALEGKRFAYSDPPEVGNPGEDYHCLPETAEVQLAPVAEILYRRRYSGKLTLIVTSSGESLRCTPNHPVLTGRGWVAAQNIEIGDQLFQVPNNVVSSSGLDVDNGVAKIGDVFEAALHLAFSETTLGGGYFHGDVSDGEVDIVDIRGLLPDDVQSLFSKHVCQLILSWADANLELAGLPHPGCITLARLRMGAAPDGLVRGACKLLALFGGHAPVPLEHRLAAVAGLDSGLKQSAADDSAAHTEFLRDGLLTPAGEIFMRDPGPHLLAIMGRAAVMISGRVDAGGPQLGAQGVGSEPDLLADLGEIQSIIEPLGRVVENTLGDDFLGHVYNLQTAGGWYQTGNIIIHNCRCRAEPDINEILEKAGSERMTELEPEPPRSIPARVAAKPPRAEQPEIIRRQRRPRKPPRKPRPVSHPLSS